MEGGFRSWATAGTRKGDRLLESRTYLLGGWHQSHPPHTCRHANEDWPRPSAANALPAAQQPGGGRPGPPAWVPLRARLPIPTPLRRALPVPRSFCRCCSLPCAGVGALGCNTSPCSPLTPPSAEPPGEITGSHMKGNFSQAEMKLKAASHYPRLPLLCQARLPSSKCLRELVTPGEGSGVRAPTQLLGCFLSSQEQ